MTSKLYFVTTDGWVTEEWLMREFIKHTDRTAEYKLFKSSVVLNSQEVQE